MIAIARAEIAERCYNTLRTEDGANDIVNKETPKWNTSNNECELEHFGRRERFKVNLRGILFVAYECAK